MKFPLPIRSELIPGHANPGTIKLRHLLPPLLDDRYAGLFGFIWLLLLFADTLCAELFGLSELERLLFGAFRE